MPRLIREPRRPGRLAAAGALLLGLLVAPAARPGVAGAAPPAPTARPPVDAPAPSLVTAAARGAGPEAGLAATAGEFAGGEFVPVAPARVFDSRLGVGRPGTAPLAAGSVTSVQVGGRGTIPTGPGMAAAANLTVTGAGAHGYVTLFACGQPVPHASNLNYRPGETAANHVLVPLNDEGRACAFVASADVHVIVDVFGWYTGEGDRWGDRLVARDPHRAFDTRIQAHPAGSPGRPGPLGPGESLVLSQQELGLAPGSATAVVLNLTAVNPTSETYVAAHPGGTPLPGVSNINVRARQTRANMVTVPFSADGRISLTNAAGQVDLVVDVLGAYQGGADRASLSGRVVAIDPTRVYDSRFDPAGPLGAMESVLLDFTPVEEALTAPLAGMFMNVTATEATGATFLAAFPGGQAWPGNSNLYVTPGETVPNLTLQRPGPTNVVEVLNGAATVHVVEDLQAIVFQ